MIMRPGEIENLADGQSLDVRAFLAAHPHVHAIAGIGNPRRYFNLLNIVGLNIQPHIFPDHHAYQPSDLAFSDGLPVLMTEKDAVKCAAFAEPIAVPAGGGELPEGLLDQMLDRWERLVQAASHNADEVLLSLNRMGRAQVAHDEGISELVSLSAVA